MPDASPPPVHIDPIINGETWGAYLGDERGAVASLAYYQPGSAPY